MIVTKEGAGFRENHNGNGIKVLVGLLLSSYQEF